MIKNISVLGAGTMGHGIACVFARHGYKVSLYEAFDSVRGAVVEKMRGELEFMADESCISKEEIEETLSRITLFKDLAEAVEEADYVIEAVPEDMKLKQELFLQLDALCPAHTIFASNTSSLSLFKLIEFLPMDRQKRSMICHWYNPALLLPIAELSFFGNMSEEVFQEVYELYVNVEKQPVKVLKDIPGLVANRMLHALAREVFSLVEQGAAEPEDIDRALRFGPGFRSAAAGILETADMGGLDIWCTVEDNLFKELNNSTRACEILRNKVLDGKLGAKSGEGFFHYPKEAGEEVKRDFQRRLIVQLQAGKNN